MKNVELPNWKVLIGLGPERALLASYEISGVGVTVLFFWKINKMVHTMLLEYVHLSRHVFKYLQLLLMFFLHLLFSVYW